MVAAARTIDVRIREAKSYANRLSKFMNRPHLRDEAESAAMLGLAEAGMKANRTEDRRAVNRVVTRTLRGFRERNMDSASVSQAVGVGDGDVSPNVTRELLMRLPKDVARVIRHRFGIADGTPKAAHWICREMGRSRAWVDRAEREGLAALMEIAAELRGLDGTERVRADVAGAYCQFVRNCRARRQRPKVDPD